MPESPEVEYVRHQIDQILPFKVKDIQVSKYVKSILKVDEFSLKDVTLRSSERKGKFLSLLTGNYRQGIVSHFGMSGGWRINGYPKGIKHTHVSLDGYSISKEKHFALEYVDPRRFGNMYILNDVDSKLNNLGVDILDKSFTFNYFYKVLSKVKDIPIKAYLLKQNKFSGIGNYMACEICALARIHPNTSVKDLTNQEKEMIFKAIREVTLISLENKGLSFHGGYTTTTGEKGEAGSFLKVFWKEFCQMCHVTKTKTILIKNRNTYYCPKCQNSNLL